MKNKLKSTESSQGSDQPAWVRAVSLFYWVVGEIVAFTGAGLLMGWYLGKHFPNTATISLLICTSLGFSIAMFRIVKKATRENQ